MEKITLPKAPFPLDCGLQYVWRAIYHDGDGKLTSRYLDQYNSDGSENKYSDIDRFLLGRFDLIDRYGNVKTSVYLHENQRLIFRRRNFVPVNNPDSRWIVYLIGWQMTITTPKGEKNITAINYVFPDGSVALDDSRTGIQLLEEEY